MGMLKKISAGVVAGFYCDNSHTFFYALFTPPPIRNIPALAEPHDLIIRFEIRGEMPVKENEYITCE
jgi:hypothetical protein